MSVNLNYAINPKKTQHFGPLFHTIEYVDLNGKGKLTIGKNTFMISSKELKELYFENKPSGINTKLNYEWKDGIELTGPEYLRLAETIETAYNNQRKREKLGI